MKLFRIFLLALIVNAMWSCAEKSVKLPVINSPGIQDTIYNNTQVWLFFKKETNDTVAELNRNNTISTTHWIFNIDKRLKLKHIIPHIQYLQAKREKPSMHKSKEVVHNFFSYVDDSTKTLSLLDFTDVNYITDSAEQIVNPAGISLSCTSHEIFINDRPAKLSSLENELVRLKDTLKLQVNLQFDKNVTYQNYLHIKTVLENIKNDSIKINTNEFIFLE